MRKKILYIKSNSIKPDNVSMVVQCYPTGHVFSERELAQSGYSVIFGNFEIDLSEDEVVLCNNGRRKVDNVDNPNGVIPIG